MPERERRDMARALYGIAVLSQYVGAAFGTNKPQTSFVPIYLLHCAWLVCAFVRYGGPAAESVGQALGR